VEALDQAFREAQRTLKSVVTQLKDKIEDTQRKINHVNEDKEKGVRRFEDQKVNLQRRMGETSEKKRAKISELEQAFEEHEVRPLRQKKIYSRIKKNPGKKIPPAIFLTCLIFFLELRE
jgi:hypothetical protein